MYDRTPFYPAVAALLLLFASMLSTSRANSINLTTMATLSSRSAKPGDHVELIVTVRNASHPLVLIPETLTGLRIKVLRKPRLFSIDDEEVWLFRYRVTPLQIGEYQLAPFQVVDGNQSTATKPLFLHVSRKGDAPPLSPEELAIGVNIPESLSQEVIKAVPQPPPKPEPTPSPVDRRSLAGRVSSSIAKALQAFWNYPGK